MSLVPRQVLQSYDIGHIRRIERIKQGYVAQKWLVTSDRGKYVLRLRPPAFSVANVADDHAFMTHLAQRSFPVPRIIPMREGTSFGVSPDGCYELLVYAPHDSTLFGLDLHHIAPDLGAFLGRFHSEARSYPGTISGKPRYVNQVPIPPEVKYFESAFEFGLPRLRRGASDDLNAELDWLVERLQELRGPVLGGLPATSQFVCHNDFFATNILVTGRRPSGLIDFGFCMTTSFLVDVVEGLHAVVIGVSEHYWGLARGGVEPQGFEAGRQFLDAYAAESGLRIPPVLLNDFLQAKIASMSLYPGFVPTQTSVERLGTMRRTRQAVVSLAERSTWMGEPCL